MTKDLQEETGLGQEVQEAPQESAPRRRRTLSGRWISAVRSDFDPWNSVKLMGEMLARRERRAARLEEDRTERAARAGINPAAGLPQVACLKSGCRVPWSEHLTATGRLRAVYSKSGGHRSAAEVPPREMDRRARRALIRSTSRRVRMPVQAAFYTHTIFRDPSGKDHRVRNEDLNAFVLRNARQNAS